jgi:hypothetical protein
VEQEQKRKALMDQQLALEREYWNTKYTFQALRSIAEKKIYSRELTALWTERTDHSPYWVDQNKDFATACTKVERWRRHPRYLPLPPRATDGTLELLIERLQGRIYNESVKDHPNSPSNPSPPSERSASRRRDPSPKDSAFISPRSPRLPKAESDKAHASSAHDTQGRVLSESSPQAEVSDRTVLSVTGQGVASPTVQQGATVDPIVATAETEAET